MKKTMMLIAFVAGLAACSRDKKKSGAVEHQSPSADYRRYFDVDEDQSSDDGGGASEYADLSTASSEANDMSTASEPDMSDECSHDSRGGGSIDCKQGLPK